MNGFRFNKLFVAVVIQVGVLTILMIFLVRRHMTAPSSGDRLSSVSHQGPLQRRCSSRLPGHMTSLKQVTNAMNSKSLGQLAVSPTDETDAKFLIKYEAFCQANLRPKASNVFVIPSEFDDCLCPCVPSGLVGFVDIDVNVQSTHNTNQSTADPHGGGLNLPRGRWVPDWCQPRHRIAIIIPYRNRQQHLRLFISHMRKLLQRQLLDFTIYVIEQNLPKVFNRGSLLNVGFIEARSRADYDCYFLHDVDYIPLNDYNMYTCSTRPSHLGAFRKNWNYKPPYDCFFGGINAFRGQDYEAINGFANSFFGWGGEDDDLLRRVWASNLTVEPRRPLSIAKYSMISHGRDQGNPVNPDRFAAMEWRPQAYAEDGLNSLRYEVVSFKENTEYTHIVVNLLPSVKPPSASGVNVTYGKTGLTGGSCQLSHQSGHHP